MPTDARGQLSQGATAALQTPEAQQVEDFQGGTTDFQFGPSVTPRRGMLLLFEHSMVHQGAPVRSGCKYVLRTDVMFRP